MAWAEVRGEFEALLALEPQARAARLEELARSRPELARELRELIEHDSQAESDRVFLAPPQEAAPQVRRIGPWELVRELGRGGMGVVHLARRADGAFERRAALKLLRPGLDDERLLERFRRETQVLANLDHPGIARLIEAGSGPDGRPWLAMDYVEGRPIDRWCDEERLDVRARIALFLQVCEAVQHAHEHLVVHRDLKPRNILVTPQGRPVLLDFGIAKVLDPEKNSAAPEVTLGVAHFLTPAYASPEQVAGRPITTASDVYSLGVVLYQLLTGELPYSVETTSAAEIERIVCQVEPGRPSERARAGADAQTRAQARGTTPTGLARTLAGDLDRVVLKALRKESRARYPSVEALAEDLRRQQAGLPVRARPDTAGYRARRFVARHRGAVAAASVAFAALVTALVVSLEQYARAQDAREDEAEQRELAERSLEEEQRLARDLAAEREAAVARVAEVERLNAELQTQRALAERRFADVRGFATTLIFELYGALAPLEGSTGAMELLARQGLEHLDRLSRESAGDALFQRELAQAWLRLSAIQGGWNNRSSLGSLDGALESTSRALELAEALLAREPDDLRNLFVLVGAATARATLLARTGHVPEALELLDQAIDRGAPLGAGGETNLGQAYTYYAARAARAQILLSTAPPQEARAEMAAGEALLADVVRRFGRAEDAVELELVRAHVARLDHSIEGGIEPIDRLAAALARLGELAARRPDDQVAARSVRVGRNAFAQCLEAEGDLVSALEQLELNASEFTAKAAVDPLDAQNQVDLFETAHARSRILLRLGRPREALELCEASLRDARVRVERAPEGVEARVLAAELAIDLGEARLALGMVLEAGESLAQALAQLEELLARHPGLVLARRAQLRALAASGGAQLGAAGSAADAALQRQALERALARLDQASAVARELAEEGLDGLDPSPEALDARRREARDALARLDGH